MSVTFDIPRVTTGPVQEPLSVSEAKAHLRIDHGDEDAYVGHLIQVAREFVETDAELSLMPQTLTLYLDEFEGDEIYIRRPPIVSVDSITYYDSNNTQQTLSTSVYQTDLVGVPPEISLKFGQVWPIVYDRENAIAITCTAGYTSAANVPAIVKQAMLMLIGHWYRNRETVAIGSTSEEVKLSYEALLSRVRWSRYA